MLVRISAKKKSLNLTLPKGDKIIYNNEYYVYILADLYPQLQQR